MQHHTTYRGGSSKDAFGLPTASPRLHQISAAEEYRWLAWRSRILNQQDTCACGFSSLLFPATSPQTHDYPSSHQASRMRAVSLDCSSTRRAKTLFQAPNLLVLRINTVPGSYDLRVLFNRPLLPDCGTLARFHRSPDLGSRALTRRSPGEARAGHSACAPPAPHSSPPAGPDLCCQSSILPFMPLTRPQP